MIRTCFIHHSKIVLAFQDQIIISIWYTMDERRKLEQTIAALEARLADLEARVPAHSIPPGIIAEMDELDEQLAQARARLAALERQS